MFTAPIFDIMGAFGTSATIFASIMEITHKFKAKEFLEDFSETKCGAYGKNLRLLNEFVPTVELLHEHDISEVLVKFLEANRYNPLAKEMLQYGKVGLGTMQFYPQHDYFNLENELLERQKQKPGVVGHHRTKRFTLKLIKIFLDLSYRNSIKLPGYFELHAEGALTGETSALLELGRLFKDLGEKFYFFSEFLFKDAWQKETNLKQYMINKLEDFFFLSNTLTRTQRIETLQAIKQYRSEMGYHIHNPNINGREYDLTHNLRRALSNQLGRYISINEMAIMFKGRLTSGLPRQDDFFRRRLYSSTRMRFGKKTLRDLMSFISNPIHWEFGLGGDLIQYNLRLTGGNLLMAQNAIENYQRIVWGAARAPYVIPEDAINRDELMILEILRLAYSKHPHLNPNYRSGGEIAQKSLFEDIIGKKRTFDRYLDNQEPFSTRLLNHIYRKCRRDLIHLYAPQEYADLCRAMSIYNRDFKSYWIQDQHLLDHLRLAPIKNEYPSTWSPSVKRMQREILAVWFANRDALTGDLLIETATLHHWQVNNPLRKSDCSLSYDLNTGRLPALVPLSRSSHGIVGNNPRYESIFREALLSVLRGRPPRHWTLENKKAFIRYKWFTALPYT